MKSLQQHDVAAAYQHMQALHDVAAYQAPAGVTGGMTTLFSPASFSSYITHVCTSRQQRTHVSAIHCPFVITFMQCLLAVFVRRPDRFATGSSNTHLMGY